MAQTQTAQTVADVLNQQVANWGVLYVKLHNYHWYVTGGSFYELHEKFEEFYTEGAKYFDDVAERLLAVNGSPVATMRDILQRSTITEATGNETPKEMVETIMKDFTTIISELKNGIETAESADDQPTADMLIHIRTNLEKNVWMLKAYLK